MMKSLPVNIVGSNEMGRYPKISNSSTYNMFISDNWLIPFSGYGKIETLISEGIGRCLFTSTRGNFMIAVIGEYVYKINSGLGTKKLGKLETASGDVSIDENNASQIAICDRKKLYIYDYETDVFSTVTMDFTPDYITFQNGYFICPVKNEPKWRLSALNDGLTWTANAQSVGAFQTKADNVVACLRLPSRNNQLFVMGNIVTQHWTNVGYTLFPYQLSTSFNIDYGCSDQSTIACGDNFVVWVGRNEKSGLAILYSTGTDIKQIEDDGINYLLSLSNHPEEAYGMIFKQDGHVFYMLTFPHPDDNRSIVVDLSAGRFYSLSDSYMNCHIARKVAFFNGEYYFVSRVDGALYKMSTSITNYDGLEIPRVRITDTIRLPDNSLFVTDFLTFTIEQGTSDKPQRIDLSISRDGAVSFGNIVGLELNPLGKRKNRYTSWRLGASNEFTMQLRFWGLDRFLITGGMINIRQ